MKIYKVMQKVNGDWVAIDRVDDVVSTVEDEWSYAEARLPQYDDWLGHEHFNRDIVTTIIDKMEIGDQRYFGYAIVSCEDMDKNQFYNLPEFEGW
jgi:hypothetical protein